jgi:hypothetical protein
VTLTHKKDIDVKNLDETKRYMRSFGISIDIDKADEESGIFHYNYSMTFLFEICFIVFLIFYYRITIKIEKQISYLDENSTKVN